MTCLATCCRQPSLCQVVGRLTGASIQHRPPSCRRNSIIGRADPVRLDRPVCQLVNHRTQTRTTGPPTAPKDDRRASGLSGCVLLEDAGQGLQSGAVQVAVAVAVSRRDVDRVILTPDQPKATHIRGCGTVGRATRSG